MAGHGELAIEVKGTAHVDDRDLRSLQLFADTHRPRLAIVVCNEREERIVRGIRLMPWQTFFQELWDGRMIGG